MKTAVTYLATNLWWPFIGGVLIVAAAVGIKTAYMRTAQWARGRRT